MDVRAANRHEVGVPDSLFPSVVHIAAGSVSTMNGHNRLDPSSWQAERKDLQGWLVAGCL